MAGPETSTTSWVLEGLLGRWEAFTYSRGKYTESWDLRKIIYYSSYILIHSVVGFVWIFFSLFPLCCCGCLLLSILLLSSLFRLLRNILFFIFFLLIPSIFFFLFFNFILFLNYRNESATGIHVFPILNPPTSSLPIPSLCVLPVHQAQASSIMHQTWTGDSFHIWYYTYFNAILPNLPTLSLSHRVHKTVLYINVSFAVSYAGLLLPSS